MTKNLYGIIYRRAAEDGKSEEWVSSVCIAENFFEARKMAEADRKKHWPLHTLDSVSWLTDRLEPGKTWMVSAI